MWRLRLANEEPVPQSCRSVPHPICDRHLPLAQRFGFCAGTVLRILCRRHGLTTKGGRDVQVQKLAAFYAEQPDKAEVVLTVGSLPLPGEDGGAQQVFAKRNSVPIQ